MDKDKAIVQTPIKEDDPQNVTMKPSKNKKIKSPFELNEKDRFRYENQIFKIIRKRENTMVVRRESDKKRFKLNRALQSKEST